MPEHTVRQGECLSSIAQAYEFRDPLTIFDHPKNEKLKTQRKTPNCLYPGDVLFIPEKDLKEYSAATTKEHRFQVRSSLKKIHVILEDPDDRPLADAPYTLVVGGQTIQGKTDGKGALDATVPISARQGELTVGKFSWTLQVGHLDPIEHAPDDGASGALHRLRNMGYSVPTTARLDEPATRSAVAVFQAREGLPVSGKLDPPTVKKLMTRHEDGSGKASGAPHPKPKPVTESKVVVPPRQPAPKAPEATPSLYDLARHQLTTFHDWVSDFFEEEHHDAKPNDAGLQKDARVAPSTKSYKSPNVLGSACACFVCTLKLVVVRQSHKELQEIHDRIGGKMGAAPPAKPEEMLSWFRDEPFGMNIVGVRRRHSFTNKFDDAMFTFFRTGVDEGDDAWGKIADKHGVADQGWILGKSKFVPCKRFGGWWVMAYTVSTDPGWEATSDGTDIGMSVLNAEDGMSTNKGTLRAGEAFLCPGWYKNTWRIGPHHKNGGGGHLALRQDSVALIERLKHPTYNAKPTVASWLRVYKGGRVTDDSNVVIHVTHEAPPKVAGDANAPHVIDLDKEDVIGIRYFDAVGINIHRGHGHPVDKGQPTKSDTVGFGKGAGTAYSEGCQVFQHSEGFDQFLRQCMLSKWWKCRAKTAADGCARATKEKFVELKFFETVAKTVGEHKQWECFSADRFGSCDDVGGTCDARYDYVLVELPAADVDALCKDFQGLKSDYTFEKGNKLFLGGAAPVAGSGSDAAAGTPAKKAPDVVANAAKKIDQVTDAPVAGACKCKLPTTDPLFRPVQTTVVSANQMFQAVTHTWLSEVGSGKSPALVEDCAIVLVGQWGLETGWGAKMMNFNFGNVKRGRADVAYTSFGTSEYYATEAKALAAVNCASHSRTLGKRTKGWGAWFDSPHAQTFFRAYDTLEQGVTAHFAILQKQANFVPAWNALVAHANGTSPAAKIADRHDRLEEIGLEFGQKLYAGHYATAADYDEKMSQMAISVWKQVKPAEYGAWKAAHTSTKLIVGKS